MYKDIITYKLAEGVTKEHLFAVAQEIVSTWMSKQPGFMKWEIHTVSDGEYTDIVYRESQQAAKEAEQKMSTIPNAQEWYACYDPSSMNTKNITTVATFS